RAGAAGEADGDAGAERRLLAAGGRRQLGGGEAGAPVAELALHRLARAIARRRPQFVDLGARQRPAERRHQIGAGRQRQFEARLLVLVVALAPERHAHADLLPTPDGARRPAWEAGPLLLRGRAMLNLNSITVRLGGRTILDGATAALPPKSRVGL